MGTTKFQRKQADQLVSCEKSKHGHRNNWTFNRNTGKSERKCQVCLAWRHQQVGVKHA